MTQTAWSYLAESLLEVPEPTNIEEAKTWHHRRAVWLAEHCAKLAAENAKLRRTLKQVCHNLASLNALFAATNALANGPTYCEIISGNTDLIKEAESLLK